MKLNVESQDWFTNPQMAGHYSAQKQVQKVKDLMAKYVKTAAQKECFAFSLNVEQMVEWHAWNFLTDKYLGQIQYVLRRIGKTPWTELLYHLYATSGHLKESLTWYLELQAYKNEFNEYFKSYSADFRFYGLKPDASLKRFIDYHTNLAVKHNFIVA